MKKKQKDIVNDVKIYLELTVMHMKNSRRKYYLCDQYDFYHKDQYFHEFLEYRSRVSMLEDILGIFAFGNSDIVIL